MSSVEFYFHDIEVCNCDIRRKLETYLRKIIFYFNPPPNLKTEFNTLDNMPNLEQFVDFNPEKEIPSLDGKVVFITGGWSQPQCSE
jgi:hypothetical protein